MSDYEPPAEMVDALAKELVSADIARAFRVEGVGYKATARFVLRRQHERECGLLDVLNRVNAEAYIIQHAAAFPETGTVRNISIDGARTIQDIIAHALAAHAKLDAPKEPTVRDAVCEAQRSIDEGVEGGTFVAVPMDDWLAIKAAVEREERR